MTTSLTSAYFTDRMAQLKQKQEETVGKARIIQLADYLPIIIKPTPSSWESLLSKLQQVINLPGLLTTVRELYDQGYGAELETAAEIALAKARKSPYCMFAAMVSKKAGNWTTKTLQVVHETWEVRRNALKVMEQLHLDASSTKAIFALAWRLKTSVLRFLGIATEQGMGIKNPAGVFFALTKKQKATV